VSDGTISFYLDHFVRTRVSKTNFCHIPYDPTASDHKGRSLKVFTSVSANKRISESFDIILPKVSCLIPFLIDMFLSVSETKEFQKSYFRESDSSGDFKDGSFSVWYYRG
jgi:hypothetical protein